MANHTARAAAAPVYATDHRRGTALAAAGVLVLSFDALLVRLAVADSATIVFWRGLFMALSLTVALRLLRKSWAWDAVRVAGLAGVVIVIGYGLSQVLFVSAVMTTRVANVVVILSAAPLFAAGLSGVFLREWVAARTWIAIALCIAGIAAVFGGSIGGDAWLGDVFALGAALTIGANFTLLRRTPGVNRLAVVGGGGLVSCLLAAPFATPIALDASQFLVLAVMGLVQMPLALVLLSEATRHLPSAEVSLFLIGETILGTYWVWLLLGEEPPGLTLIGGGLVIATLIGHSWLSLTRRES